MDWDDLTNAISEIDDYVAGIGKGIASTIVGNTADMVRSVVKGTAQGAINLGTSTVPNAPKAKVKVPKTPLNTLGEDWFNESERSKNLTFNVLDTSVGYVLNTSTQIELAQKLTKENPGKYTGILGFFDAMGKAQEQAFGKREGLAWYEQDPNRVQYGEVLQGAFDENAPLLKPYEERMQYWQSKDKLDDVMWTTLGAMIIADPLNLIPGGQAKQIEKVRDVQNIIDALNDAKTTEEAMEVVKGFNWQERLPLAADPQTMKRSELYKNKPTPSDIFFGPLQKPINGETYQLEDIKKIKKQLLEIQKNEIRGLVDGLELQRIQREVTLMATTPRRDLLIKGSQEYKDAVDEMFPMFVSYSDLPEDVRITLPEQSGYNYTNIGNDVWAISNGLLLQWVPKVTKGTARRVEESEDLYVRGIKSEIKTAKESKTTGGKWRAVNIIPKHEAKFLTKISNEKQPTVPEEIMRDVTFYSNKGRNRGNEFIAQVATPVSDSYLLRFPIFRNEFISGTRSQRPLPPRVEGFTYPFDSGLRSQTGVTSGIGTKIDKEVVLRPEDSTTTPGINFDPESTKFIEVTIKDNKGKPRKLQLAIVNEGINAGVYHLDFYKRTEKPKPAYKPLTDEQVDELFAKGLGNIVGDRKRAEVATNLLNRLTSEDFNKLAKEERQEDIDWILNYSDEEFVANLSKMDVVEKEQKLAETMQRLHYDPATGEFLDTVDNDADISEFFYRSLDDTSVNDFADEFGDGMDEAFSKFDQGVNVAKGPKVETNQLKKSERMPVWVYDNTFRWDKVDSYSGTYLNPITGRYGKFEVSTKYQLINPAEVANGAVPKFIDVKPNVGKSLGPEGTVYTFGVTGELIRFDDLNVERMVYEKNLLNAQMSRAEFERSLVVERAKAATEERKTTESIRPVPLAKPGEAGVIDRMVNDEIAIEELKQTDPYAYESYMESMYGVPREVTFGFKIKRGYSQEPTTVSLTRTTQEFDGYGAKEYYGKSSEPVEEILHTWSIQPQDFKALNDRMFERNGLTVTSKGFKTRFLGETVDEDNIAKPLKIAYQDLDRFGTIRWNSDEMSIRDMLDHFDTDVRAIDQAMSAALTFIQRFKDNPMRADGVASQRLALENLGIRRKQVIASRTEVTEKWMQFGEQSGTRRMFTPPTPSFYEVEFQRWIDALNYYGKANAGIMDNLPTTSQELDALRKGLVAQTEKNKKIVTFQNIANNPDGVFVFGSNLAGRHGKGAALDAKNTYGAVQGVGKGLTGRSYALPTKGEKLEKLELEDIKYYVDEFIDFAEKNPNKTFYVTSFGTGLAGNKVEDIATMFDRIPSNVKFTAEPNGSRNILGTAINDLRNAKPIKASELEPAPMTMGKVDLFRGENSFLSNMSDSPIIINGESYPTVEHAFQAAKFSDPAKRKAIAEAKTAADAKRLGKQSGMRPDWNERRVKIMEDILRAKFDQNAELKQKLIDTGDTELIEGNTWGDKFWGQVDGIGENNLGKLLMKLREEFGSKTTNEPAPMTMGKVANATESSAVTIHSGGAEGADRAWAVVADELGIETKAHSFEGHSKGTDWVNAPKLEERVIHTQEEFKNITTLVNKAGSKLGGKGAGTVTENGQLVHRNAFQVINSEAVICVTDGLQKLPSGEMTVAGSGTPWAAEMAKELKKPLYNYSQSDNSWLKFNYETREWDYIDMPPKFDTFAGIGTRKLTSDGKKAIRDYLSQFKKAE